MCYSKSAKTGKKWVDLVFVIWSCCQGDLVERTSFVVLSPHSHTFRRHRSRHHHSQFSAPSYELVKETNEVNSSTNVLPKTVTLSLLLLSSLIYTLFTLSSHFRAITTYHLFTFHSSRDAPFHGKVNVASSHLLFTRPPLFRSANPTRAYNPDLPYLPEDPFLIFLVDRFHSVPVPVCFLLQALFLKPLEVRTVSPHQAKHLGSGCHGCRYQAFTSRIVSLIKPMLFEQTVDTYLWSHAAS
ncbi:unnamed protein product [Protopolystoma xenopodis]|uniref:Uncharacterized protein n=1 Tax=Protopolystoma xenopodis TaxID=117903 RepID=A0A3S5AUG5_9PLAT|nr:unnamed protein product [Protopolystoma xenopodis]